MKKVLGGRLNPPKPPQRGSSGEAPGQGPLESFNPSLRLFERLGFRKTKQDDFNFLMQWGPAGREADATRNPSPNQSNQPAAGDLTEPHD